MGENMSVIIQPLIEGLLEGINFNIRLDPTPEYCSIAVLLHRRIAASPGRVASMSNLRGNKERAHCPLPIIPAGNAG
jgi:hypothetical protein